MHMLRSTLTWTAYILATLAVFGLLLDWAPTQLEAQRTSRGVGGTCVSLTEAK